MVVGPAIGTSSLRNEGVLRTGQMPKCFNGGPCYPQQENKSHDNTFLATRKCQEPVEPSAITSHCEAVIRAAAILLAILSSEWCTREKAVRTAAVDGKNVARTVQRTFPTAKGRAKKGTKSEK